MTCELAQMHVFKSFFDTNNATVATNAFACTITTTTAAQTVLLSSVCFPKITQTASGVIIAKYFILYMIHVIHSS